MSGKLDQSLDEILGAQRRTARQPGRGHRVSAGGKSSTTRAKAPVGGIKKTTRASQAGGKGNVPTGPASGSGESKVIVSNLPTDVLEAQIKEYFSKSVGQVKKAQVTYGPNGVSRGIATVIFSRADGASNAVSKLNNLLVDGKPIKIEVVLDAARAPPPPKVKTLSERIAQPKAQPKPVSAAKTTGNNSARGGRANRGRARGRNAGRAKPKTADELDAEMVDYFDAGAENGGAANGTGNNGGSAPGANSGGDTGMDDIL
ncbi:MAG: hypothetical protein M1829_006813 [Trizodia sp. TS-e1964]|nr:MAG: hypothetical protein M1829_006813 [Trizodia sp. TS-e1964]